MTEKKVIETQYGWYQKNDNKVNVDEIIGIVKTDEQTNSVQLKKEAQLSICEKRVLELEKENEQLHSELAEKDIQIDYLKNENKHFQQRNNRQAEQLDNLYNLIEKEDWQTLKGIIQEFQECEEQLQKEWECYE